VSLPKSLVICGHRFAVETRERSDMPGEEDSAGVAQIEHQRITLRNDLAPDQMRDALLHETVHMTADLNKLTKLDERSIHLLTTHLLDTFRRNPDLVAYLMEI
jgi:hypothetical protein